MAGVLVVGEAPSLTGESKSVEKCAREEPVSRTIPSLAPPPGSAAKRVALPR